MYHVPAASVTSSDSSTVPLVRLARTTVPSPSSTNRSKSPSRRHITRCRVRGSLNANR